MSLNKELLDLLVCPECRESLTLCPAEDGLCCERCQAVYPVRDGIPVMLVSDRLGLDEWNGSLPGK
ncbi:MAG: Trm112 family protein [Desulfovibrionaceae bacterium]